MTMMAELPVPLQRLFDRLDSAPRPKNEMLHQILEQWSRRRDGKVGPSRTAVHDLLQPPFALNAFIFEGVQDGTLMAGGQVLGPLLGHCPHGATLTEAPFRRGAVRLRRLFGFVHQTEAPLLAEFTDRGAKGERLAFELLLAPLSEDGRTVTAFLGGLAARPVRETGQQRGGGKGETAGPLIFAPQSSAAFGQQVARGLGMALSPLEERAFEDAEHKTRPLVSVRGRDVFVLSSLSGSGTQSVNDRLCRLLFLIGGMKTNGAQRVTAVVPYLCYQRKDRQTKARDPLTARYVAQMFEAVGTDRVITMEAHNVAAFQNAFRCPTLHLTPYRQFVDYFAREIGDAPAAVVSPDLGGAKRAEAFREMLEVRLGRPVGKAFMDKHRSMGKVTGALFTGDVEGCYAIVIDDLISSGTTMARVVAACRVHGARAVYLAATHGLFTQDAGAKLSDPAISKLVITDTVPVQGLEGGILDRLVVLPVADVFADAIRRCHVPRNVTSAR